jgi:hypothetical protein
LRRKPVRRSWRLEEARLRLVTIRRGDTEEAAVVLPDGVAPVREVYGTSGEGADLLSLLESGRFYELG